MKTFDYVIVGGGMAARAAIRGIREVDARGTIAVLGQEPHAPYQRPPLSKGLWLGKEEDSIWYEPVGEGVSLLTTTVAAIDRDAHRVRDAAGELTGYRKLLLATGGTPRSLGPPHERVIPYRTLDDFHRLKALTRGAKRVVVVGGGFIGSELAAALRQNDVRVALVVPEERLCARIFPADLGRSVTELFREKGVEVITGEFVEHLETGPSGVRLHGRSGKVIDGAAVVLGLGITPNVQLALDAGLAVSDGVEVNASLQTTDPDIYAAGDVANVESAALGKRVRVEHEDAALTMGAHAGRAMAGNEAPYTHLPFFYSDLFELGYEAVGDVDPRQQTVADWRTPFREGVVYYLRDGHVQGVLLFGVFGKVDEARALIESRKWVDETRVLYGRISF